MSMQEDTCHLWSKWTRSRNKV